MFPEYFEPIDEISFEMSSKRNIKYLFIIAVMVVAGFALVDALGYFNPRPYTIVKHGAMSHYVPYNREPDVKISRFPTRPPGPDELITPTGQIVKKSVWEQEKKDRNRHSNEDTTKNESQNSP